MRTLLLNPANVIDILIIAVIQMLTACLLYAHAIRIAVRFSSLHKEYKTYTVFKTTVKIVFLNFVKFSQTLIIFWHKDHQDDRIM